MGLPTASNNKIDYVTQAEEILNLKGNLNCIIDSKVTVARVNKIIHLQMCQVSFAAAAFGDITEFSPPEKHHLLQNILAPKVFPLVAPVPSISVSWVCKEQPIIGLCQLKMRR